MDKQRSMQVSNTALEAARSYAKKALHTAMDEDPEFVDRLAGASGEQGAGDLSGAVRHVLYMEVLNSLYGKLPGYVAKYARIPPASMGDEQALGRTLESLLVGLNLTKNIALGEDYKPKESLEDYIYLAPTDYSMAFYALKYGYIDAGGLAVECMAERAAAGTTSLLRAGGNEADGSDSAFGFE